MTYLSQPNYNSDQALGYTHPKFAQQFFTGSVMIGENTSNPHFYVKKATGTPSGNITFRCWDSSGNVLHTYGTYDSTQLTSAYQLITPDSDTAYTTPLANGDMIGCEFTGSSSLYYHVAFDTANQIDNATYQDYRSSSSSWVNQSPADLGFKINYGASPPPETTSTRLPPPPIVLGGY